MKIDTNEKGEFILKEVYSGITLETDGNKISICMRDNGFEINYNGNWYEAKGSHIVQSLGRNDIFDDDIPQIDEYDMKQLKDEDLCLTEVHVSTSEKKYAEILQIIESHSHTYDFKLTKSPLGKKQPQSNEHIKHIYVNQITDGGESGKEFGGSISIEYNIGEFLQFSYFNYYD